MNREPEITDRDLDCVDLLMLGVLGLNAGAAALWSQVDSGTCRSYSYGLTSDPATKRRLGYERCELQLELENLTLIDRISEHLTKDDTPIRLNDLASALPGSPFVQAPFLMRWAYCVALSDREKQRVGILMIMDRWEHEITKEFYRVVAAMSRSFVTVLESEPRPAADEVPAPSAIETTAEGGALPSRVLRTAEVAKIFAVSPRTVDSWATSGRIPSLRTMGGHFRFRADDVLDLLYT